MSRPLRAIFDLTALEHNYLLAEQWANPARLLPVLKANAYGHGAVICAKALSSSAKAFGVASIEEALHLREAGIEQPILLMEGFFSAEELPIIAKENFWTCIHSRWQVEALLKTHLVHPLQVWLKFDSGMHRLGFSCQDFVEQWKRLQDSPQVDELVFMSHFATADAEEKTQAHRQLTQIKRLTRHLKSEQPIVSSLSNSAALLNLSEVKNEWVRPGILLYGVDPMQSGKSLKPLHPVMTLESEIIAINEIDSHEAVGYGAAFITARRTRLAVVACGYADGYDRHAQNGTPVLVEEKRAPLIGRVAMDMLTIDVTDIPEAHVGSVVTLWGKTPKGQFLDINEVAQGANTISYTLLTNLNARVNRTVIPSNTHCFSS